MAEVTTRAFGGGGKGKSTPGSVEGNSTTTGNVTGTPGNGVKGRTLENGLVVCCGVANSVLLQ